MTETVLFSPDVVDAITRHMNDDHAEDNVLICRALGSVPDAEEATMVGLDGDGIFFTVSGPTGPRTVRIPWSRSITERAEVRAEVVRMYRGACTALGVEPRQ